MARSPAHTAVEEALGRAGLHKIKSRSSFGAWTKDAGDCLAFFRPDARTKWNPHFRLDGWVGNLIPGFEALWSARRRKAGFRGMDVPSIELFSVHILNLSMPPLNFTLDDKGALDSCIQTVIEVLDQMPHAVSDLRPYLERGVLPPADTPATYEKVAPKVAAFEDWAGFKIKYQPFS